MLRSVFALLASIACFLLAAAVGHAADSLSVNGGALTYEADPGAPAVDLRIGSRVNSACEFNLPDGTPYSGGSCLLIATGDREGYGDRTLTVGAGCTPIGKDDAFCPLAGISRVSLRTGPGNDEVHLGELEGWGRYYWIGTDEPIAMPVPFALDLGAGDDVLEHPDSVTGTWPIPGAEVRCGDGVDELKVGSGLKWFSDCETGDGQSLEGPGSSGGSLLRDGDVLRYVSPRSPLEDGPSISVGTGLFRGTPVLSVSGPTPQDLGPGCLVLGSDRQNCPLDGLRRVEVVGPRDQPASVDVEAPGYGDSEREPGPPLPPVHIDLGAKADGVDTRGPAAQHISCGGGIDTVQASAQDEVEADCELVKGGRRLPGANIAIGRRSAWRRMPGNDAYKNRTFLTLTCPASIADDSCGGTVRLEYQGTKMGSYDYALSKGEKRRIDFFFGRGSVAFGGELGRAYAAMRRAIRDRGGAKLRAVVFTGASTFNHPLKLTRMARGGGRPA